MLGSNSNPSPSTPTAAAARDAAVPRCSCCCCSHRARRRGAVLCPGAAPAAAPERRRSTRLRESFEHADADRRRLKSELDAASSPACRETLDENKRLASGPERAQRDGATPAQDIASLVSSAAARSARHAGGVARRALRDARQRARYDVVLSRERHRRDARSAA
jgi:hypothetical protein